MYNSGLQRQNAAGMLLLHFRFIMQQSCGILIRGSSSYTLLQLLTKLTYVFYWISCTILLYYTSIVFYNFIAHERWAMSNEATVHPS